MPVRVTHRLNRRGLEDLRLSTGIRNDIFRRSVRVQTAARNRLGFDPRRIDTGRLRASIAVAIFVRDNTWVGHIGTNVEYAPFVHEGTRFMRANPFLRDALSAAGSRRVR